MSMQPFQIRSTSFVDKEWITTILTTSWGSIRVVSRGKVYDISSLPGFVAILEEKPVGLITYNIKNNECEIVTLVSTKTGIGIGSALVEKVKAEALKRRYKRLWVITTNDNTESLRFYQKRGFTIKAIHVNSMEKSRKLKPEIPLIGLHGIPLRDEIELEIFL